MLNAQRLLDLIPRPLAATMLVALGASGFATTASAHPHIWVTVRSTLLFENGAATALQLAWTFDEYYTAMAIDGLDKNGDGKYSREELAELAKVNMDGLKEFAYFTQPLLGQAEIKLAPPRDSYLEHAVSMPDGTPAPAAKADASKAATPASPQIAASGATGIATAAQKPAGHLTLHFTLPFAKPVSIGAADLTFNVADPTYFIGFEPAGDHALTLGPGAPAGCRVVPPKAEPTAAANPAQASGPMASQPAAPTINFVASPEYRVLCGAAQ